MSMAIDIDPESNTVKADRHLRVSGSSKIISIPPQILQTLEWEKDEELELEANWETGELTIRKAGEEDEE